jgi:hypothetical protein
LLKNKLVLGQMGGAENDHVLGQRE